MENNTITPNPEPKPQPIAPMPVFGSAVPTPTVTPEAAPSPTLSTSAMPIMSAQATPAPAAAPLSSPTSTPAVSTVAPAASPAGAPAPAAPVAPVAPVAPATPATPVVPAAPAAPIAEPAPATQTTNPITSAPNLTAPVAPASAPAAAEPSATMATPVTTPATDPATTPATTPTTQPPINKGRLIALIAIIAGLLVAGIIAAVCIVLITSSKPTPVADANAALANLESPAGAPASITGSLELVSGNDVLASASVVLEGSNLFFSYDGLSSLLDDYLGLSSVADQDSIASLATISGILQIAESTWWQIPVEELTLAAEYRAHPFLTLASSNANEVHLKIDSGRFADFLTELDLDFSATAETNCIDGPSGTNCGSSDSAGLSLFGITSMPTASQVKETATSIDILATIDTQNRITSMYAVLGEDDFVVNVKLNLVYAGASLSPEEYRPITELMSEFLQAIGY